MDEQEDNLELNPPASPCYARPPWSYTGARVLNIVCRAEHPKALQRWVPAPLQPAYSDGLFVMFFLRVPRIPELGPHYHSTECGILVPVVTSDGALKGSTVAIMFVDNDVALAAGREIWGYPKKLGQITFEETGDREIRAAARHLPYRDVASGTVFSADVVLDGSGSELWPVVAALEPRLLRRAIPDPYGPRAQSVELLKVAHTGAKVYEERSGRATVRIEPSLEHLELLGKIETLGATFRVCDFVLPYAQRIS
jgi:acetoacetate decarboxylase